MTYAESHLAPGCFGSALTFKATAEECRTCEFAARCQPLSEMRLATMRIELGIEVRQRRASPRTGKIEIKDPTGSLVQVPSKVAELLGRFERAGIRVTEALREGRNPFVTTPTFMRVACHLLLAPTFAGSGLSRSMIAEALERKLNWSQGTAAAHALQAAQALVALGAVNVVEGRYFLKDRG